MKPRRARIEAHRSAPGETVWAEIMRAERCRSGRRVAPIAGSRLTGISPPQPMPAYDPFASAFSISGRSTLSRLRSVIGPTSL